MQLYVYSTSSNATYIQSGIAYTTYTQSCVYGRETTEKGITMLNKDLLNELKVALEENDKEKFIDLCYSANIENTLVDNNFHGLGVVISIINENNSTFIDNLYQCADNKNYPLIERLEVLNDRHQFKPYHTEANDIASKLYSTYEDELDSILIWNNAEKIIKDLEDYLLTKED